MNWLIQTMRDNPSIAIFLTIGLGFLVGKLKYKTFSLGTVTSVLLVGVLVGQLGIPVPGPVKSVFFLLFLFAIGYSVGPEFFRALKGSGIKQVLFAVVMCVICFLVTWGVALLFHYNVGEALGLFAGAQTISAVITLSSFSDSSSIVRIYCFLILVSIVQFLQQLLHFLLIWASMVPCRIVFDTFASIALDRLRCDHHRASVVR